MRISTQNSEEPKELWLYIVIPVLCISIAELLIFSGRMEAAIWVHAGILITLSFSSIFIKDLEINKIHHALMLLPVLRLINLSIPIFFTNILYTFICVYGLLAIPVAILS